MGKKIGPFKKGDVVMHRGHVWVVTEDEGATHRLRVAMRNLEPVDMDELGALPASVPAFRVVEVPTPAMVFPCPAAGGHAVLEETPPGYGWWEGRLVPGSGLRFEVDVELEEVQAEGEVPRFALKAYQHGDVYVEVCANLDYDGLAEWFLRVQRWFE